ncbi:MAG: Ig-like domain-containing protein, partial [Candidatus Latescibacterota bacterium]
MAVPTVVSAIPDTLVDEDSPPINNYRDLNDVFYDPEDGDSLDFIIHSNSNPLLVTAVVDADSALGLSFTPELSGSATIVIRATDSEMLFVEDTLVVTVNAVNDDPTVVVSIPDTTVLENALPVENFIDLNDVFDDIEDGNALGFTIQSNSNPALVAVVIDADSSLDLSFTPDDAGKATIVIRATDSGAFFVDESFVVTVHRTLWHIKADGSGQAPSIQAGLNAAVNGDTVLLYDGTFMGGGNTSIDFNGKAVLLTSVNGPEVTIIDCEGNDRAFIIDNSEGPGTIISQVTVRNGDKTNGANIKIDGASPTINGCIIEGGTAGSGGGIYCDVGGSPTISSNIFIGNSADEGGAIYCNGVSAIIQNNTLIGNSAVTGGGGIHLRNSSDATISNTIIAFGVQGPAIVCAGGANPTISCSNVYGNAGGDAICGTDGGGNISADPLFCGPIGSGVVTIATNSPCAPANNSCGVLIGAYPVACGGPMVVSAIPDTTVIDGSPPIADYRDLNDVFLDIEDGSALEFTIESNSNPAVVAVSIDADSALDLSFTSGQSGSATIVVRATDSELFFAEETFTVTVLGIITAEASRVWSPPVHPADPVQPMFWLSLRNSAAVPETLTALTFTNKSIGAGSQSELDASFSPMMLSAASGAGLLPGNAPGPPTASFSSGKLTFSNLEAVIPAMDTLILIVDGGASLTARDGDVLDLSLAGATDIGFSRSVLLTANWPMNPLDVFPVDGMVAAQLTLYPVDATTFSSGTADNVALDILLPANGYEADVLNRLNVINLGSAVDTVDVILLEAWADNGDGLLQAGMDTNIGSFSFTGSRWELTGLSYPVPLAGLRVFITADISETAVEGRSIRLGLPTVPDLAVGMDSRNDGPLDAAVINPFSQTIVSSERVLLTAVPLAARTVHPGERGALLMHLVATNNYGVPKQITGLIFANGTVPQGSATQAE